LIDANDLLVLAMPVPALEGALRDLRPHLRPDHLVFDVGSVKVGPCGLLDAHLGAAIPHVGTHPLFGPVSLARAERPLRVVLCPSAHHPAAATTVEGLFQGLGCEVLRQSAEDHDRVMATTHALTFFIAKGLLAVGAGAELPFTPPSFHAIARTLESVREDAGHLFAALQNENPFASGAREGLLEALAAIHRSLAEAAESGGGEHLSIPDLGARSPALQEARDHIDALDQELVGLLARRTELVLRAGRAKAELNLPIHDPEREASQLQARRDWAKAAGLDATEVEEVFRAVLRSSRAAQGHAG
jgi:prephenate dehydrogenase